MPDPPINPAQAAEIAQEADEQRKLGRHEEAIAGFTRAVELDPSYAWAYAQRGDTYRRMERCDEALADLDRAVALEPHGSTWKDERRLVLAALGRPHDEPATGP